VPGSSFRPAGDGGFTHTLDVADIEAEPGEFAGVFAAPARAPAEFRTALPARPSTARPPRTVP